MEPVDGAQEPTDWRAVGGQIEALLAATTSDGPVARERTESLVRLLSDLYGAGLRRILEVLDNTGRLDDTLEKALVGDELISSLLLIHDLHPQDVHARVEAALERVRPYLGSHGGDVEILGVSEAGVVTLRMLGSCDGCPSSAVTLEVAVEDAIMSAAPEVTSIEVEQAESERGQGSATLIPIESLRVRLKGAPQAMDTSWLELPELESLADGEIGGFAVDERRLIACRLGPDLFAYADECARCGESLAGAVLQRQLGSPDKTVALTCPQCKAHFDVRRAGASLDDEPTHLRPLPLVSRDGVPTVAISDEVPA